MSLKVFKRGEETISGLLYTGQDNLEELLDFTGKAPEWDKFFKSMDEYKQYVAERNGVFKIYYIDGGTADVEPGEWVFKNHENGAVFSTDPLRLKRAGFKEQTDGESA